MFHKKYSLISALVLISPLGIAGPLDSPAPPTDPGSAMYSIDDVCNRLMSGAAGTKTPFANPTSGPSDIGCTLNDIMDKAPSKDNTNGVQPGEVIAGKRYWGFTDSNWGPQTGSLPNRGAVPYTCAPTDQAIEVGYHNGSVIKGDANLSPENIKQGVTIFGVTGTFVGTSGQPQPVPPPSTPISLPSSSTDRYTDNGNGTVTDNRSGLIWLKNANCFGREQGWETGMQSAANLMNGQCGLSDGSTLGMWRLPTIEEWEAMIDKNYENPTLSNAVGTGPWREGDAFSGVQTGVGDYWSSTTFSGSTSYAWYVVLDDGVVNSWGKSSMYYIWPVRGGQ